MDPRSQPLNPNARARPARRAVGLVAGLVILAVLAVGAYGLWYLFLQAPGPAPVGQVIDAGSPMASTSGGPASASASSVAASDPASGSNSTSGSASASGSGSASGSLDGTWKIDTSVGSFSDFTDSFVGYRVQEQLASVGANTAVGRTPNVSGSRTLEGTRVTTTEITADLTALQSDDQRRDGQLRQQGLQTGQFPTATFKLTTPIDLGSIPADGQTIKVTASGELTLRGQTKAVTLAIQATLNGSTIQVTGSLQISFADYGMTPPDSFAVLSVADTGTMEFQLFFTKS